MNFGIGNLRTGILNVADLSITFGVIIFIIYDLFFANDKLLADKKETTTDNTVTNSETENSDE